MTFCGSDFEDFYTSFLPGKLHFTEFRPDVVESLKAVNEQRTGEGIPQLPILIILDDCSESRERYDDELRSLYTRGRHWNLSVLFASQAVQLSDTVSRNNSDFVLIGLQRGGGGRELVIESFLKGLPEVEDLPVVDGKRLTEKQFLTKLVRKNTQNYSFIVITTSNPKESEFSDIVKTYKSPIESFVTKRKKKLAVEEDEEIIILEELPPPQASQ